jgi:hypothetical protein
VNVKSGRSERITAADVRSVKGDMNNKINLIFVMNGIVSSFALLFALSFHAYARAPPEALDFLSLFCKGSMI